MPEGLVSAEAMQISLTKLFDQIAMTMKPIRFPLRTERVKCVSHPNVLVLIIKLTQFHCIIISDESVSQFFRDNESNLCPILRERQRLHGLQVRGTYSGQWLIHPLKFYVKRSFTNTNTHTPSLSLTQSLSLFCFISLPLFFLYFSFSLGIRLFKGYQGHVPLILLCHFWGNVRMHTTGQLF